jgi:hypothetical protein
VEDNDKFHVVILNGYLIEMWHLDTMTCDHCFFHMV